MDTKGSLNLKKKARRQGYLPVLIPTSLWHFGLRREILDDVVDFFAIQLSNETENREKFNLPVASQEIDKTTYYDEYRLQLV